MDVLFTVLLIFHIGSAVVWLGTTAVQALFLQPALWGTPPEARRPVLARLAPRVARGLQTSLTAVFIFGLLLVWRHLGFGRLGDLFTTKWGLAIFIGFLMALAFSTTSSGIAAPTLKRLAAAIKASTLTEEQAVAMQARIRRSTLLGLVFGVFALTAMVVAASYG